MPTANYAAELFETFRKASLEKVEIKLETKQAAFALRYRLNKLRSEMRKEGHYMLEVAEGCSFIIEKERPNVLIGMPADMNYLSSIRDAIGAPSPEAIKAQEAMPLESKPSHGPRISGEIALQEFFESTKKGE